MRVGADYYRAYPRASRTAIEVLNNIMLSDRDYTHEQRVIAKRIRSWISKSYRIFSDKFDQNKLVGLDIVREPETAVLTIAAMFKGPDDISKYQIWRKDSSQPFTLDNLEFRHVNTKRKVSS